MAKTLDLNHGPWEQVFSGQWQGHEVDFYQNPDKWTMLMIVDKEQEQDQARGILIQLTKYFTFKGMPESLVAAMGGTTLVFEKTTPSFKANYLAISSKARYAKPSQDSIHEMIEENFAELREKSEQIIESSTSYKVDLVELKNESEEIQAHLFVTPDILTGIMTSESSGVTTQVAPAKTTNDAVVLMGMNKAGEPAELIAQSFLTTIVYGKSQEIKRATHVAIESCILSNVMVVVYDDTNYFERIKTPNKNFDKEHYPTLQPIGMPVKTIAPDEVGINTKLITQDMLKEILMINDKSEQGQRAFDHIAYYYDQTKTTWDDLIRGIQQEQDPKKLFDARRAVRFLNLYKQLYPNYFKNETDTSLLISAYTKSTAQVIRIPTDAMNTPLKKATMLTIISALNDYYKGHQSSTALKLLHAIPDAGSLLPPNDSTHLGTALTSAYAQAKKIGIGFLLGLTLDQSINAQIKNEQTLYMEFVTPQEVAMKTKNGNPQRITLRPPLSAY